MKSKNVLLIAIIIYLAQISFFLYRRNVPIKNYSSSGVSIDLMKSVNGFGAIPLLGWVYITIPQNYVIIFKYKNWTYRDSISEMNDVIWSAFKVKNENSKVNVYGKAYDSEEVIVVTFPEKDWRGTGF